MGTKLLAQEQRKLFDNQSKKIMSATTETVMTPTLPVEPAPAKVVKKRGPKKKTAKEPQSTETTEKTEKTEKNDKNVPIETDKKVLSEKKEEEEEEPETQEISETQEVSDETAKKTRTPTLSANNKRYVQFTYFLLNKLKDTHPELDTDALYDTFKVFDSVDNQLLFLNTFDQDAVKSSMKKHKADLKKTQADFSKLEKKLVTKIKRTKNVSPLYEANNTLVSITFNGADTVDDPKLLSSTLVLDAIALKNCQNNTTSQQNTVQELQLEQDYVAQIVATANNKTLPLEQKKDTDNDNDNDNDTDTLDVQLCKILDKTFLIDKNNNLYHHQKHNLLAHFDPIKQTIHYI